jgi:hypothetical protein
MQNDEAEIVRLPERLGADVVPMPRLERLPESEVEEGPAGFRGLDSRSSRLEALELVRAAVEFADRIERDAQDTANDRLARAEEELRLRRISFDEREADLEHAKTELETSRQEQEHKRQDLEAKQHELEQYREKVVEATKALRARAEREATEMVAAASAQAEALIEHARGEAAGLTEAARSEAVALAQAARTEAAELAHAARAEAEQIERMGRTEGEELAQAARAEAEPIPQAPTEAEQLLTRASAVPEAPPAPEAPAGGSELRAEPVAEEFEPEVAVGEPEAQPAEPRAFTPPPVSVEDLATVSSLPRLGIRSRLRDRRQ